MYGVKEEWFLAVEIGCVDPSVRDGVLLLCLRDKCVRFRFPFTISMCVCVY